MSGNSLKIAILLSLSVMIGGDEGRQLVYINGGLIKFVIGSSIPVKIHAPIVVLMKNQLQASYPVISNATQISDLFASGIQKGLRYSKNNLYTFLQEILNQGIEGENCLKRLICELSETPIDSNSFLGDILQYLFTPDETVDEEYRAAWEIGQNQLHCQLKLPCSHISIFHAITAIKYFT